MVNAEDSKPSAARLESSSLSPGTKREALGRGVPCLRRLRERLERRSDDSSADESARQGYENSRVTARELFLAKPPPAQSAQRAWSGSTLPAQGA